MAKQEYFLEMYQTLDAFELLPFDYSRYLDKLIPHSKVNIDCPCPSLLNNFKLVPVFTD